MHTMLNAYTAHSESTSAACIPSSSIGAEQSLASRTTLKDLLSNHLISSRIVPHLSIQGQLAVAGTNKALRSLVIHQPRNASSFQYVNLSHVHRAQLNTNGPTRQSEDLDPALTEDDFYSRPLKAIFHRLEKQQFLCLVSTLILDGLCVPTEIVRQIIMDDRFSVRILSVRDVQQLNTAKLCQTLRYVSRPSRPAGTPKLRGLYIFGPKEVVKVKESERWTRRRSPTRFVDVTPQEAVRVVGQSLGEEWNRRSMETLAKDLENHDDKWYLSAGKVITRTPHEEWAQTLMVCEGIIHFDAVLCRGPRHMASTNGAITTNYLPPAIATIALGSDGCDTCKGCPEGPGVFDKSPACQLPLLAPPPFSVSTIRAAQMPSSSMHEIAPRLIVRCAECLKGRWCERCHKWWCESCYVTDAQPVARQATNNVNNSSDNLSLQHDMSIEQTVKVHMNLCTEYRIIQDTLEMWTNMPGNGQF